MFLSPRRLTDREAIRPLSQPDFAEIQVSCLKIPRPVVNTPAGPLGRAVRNPQGRTVRSVVPIRGRVD